MKYISKISLLLAFMVYGTATLMAQSYGNEWIDYNKTYYKFKVGRTGICRIQKSALDAIGVPTSVSGANFMLYRDGQEVPVFVTTNGTFSTGDYIEFVGKQADGKMDTELYGDSSIQADRAKSLISDTAAYFLTYDNATSGHLRYNFSNPAPNGAGAEQYCLYTLETHGRGYFYGGYSYATGYLFNSSQFDRGEGFGGQQTGISAPIAINMTTSNLVSSGPNATVKFSVVTQSYTNQHYFKLYVNNQQADTGSCGPLDTKVFNSSAPASWLSSSNTEVKVVPYNLGSATYDYYGVGMVSVEYPRNFDMTAMDFMRFRLQAKSTEQYLEIPNLVSGTAPRLYDVTNMKWYKGDTTVAGKVTYYIDGSAQDREMVVYSSGSSNIANVTGSKKINFTNYTAAANQGNYIILTHPSLMDASGHNYIQDYKNYRSSAAGGGYSTVVADVTELYDQFAYGYDIHPLSIKHFLSYAYDKWTTKPSFAFFIGRGIKYYQYNNYLTGTGGPYLYPIVPTYGDPGSDIDFVMNSTKTKLNMSVGRLSAWNGQEVGIYLDKVKAFESAVKTPALPSYASESWKKQVLHIAGSADASLQNTWLLPTLYQGKTIIEDTALGASVFTVAKSTTNPVDNISSAAIDSMINAGLAIITFHGHASASGFDFNLNSPEQYNSLPRLPLFVALGCDVSQIYDLNTQKTISERYIDAQNGGSIGMIAADNMNFPDFHQYYLAGLYTCIGQRYYGQTIGEQYKGTFDSLMHFNNTGYFLAHLESLLLQGDPGVRLYSPAKPDFYVTNTTISSIPANVTTSQDSFKLKIVGYNLGRAIDDTVTVKVEHTNPAGVTAIVGTYKIINLHNTDTALFNVPVNKLNDLGLNKYRVTIDAPNKFDELSEANNVTTVELFIYSDNLVPVYPQNFSIVHAQGVTLKASTINPFRPIGRYRMEIDTTELFNSPSLQQTAIVAPSGVVKWTPSLAMKDSTVYYWRTAYDSSINGVYQWAGSSFIYLANGSDGWNQSHYYQYQKDAYDSLSLNPDRLFRFGLTEEKLTIWNKISGTDLGHTRMFINDIPIQNLGLDLGGTLMVMVFDSATGKPWQNTNWLQTGAHAPNGNANPPRDVYAYEFQLYNSTGRNNARKFIDSIPNGEYVLVYNFIYGPAFAPYYANSWAADTSIYGSGISLYHTLKNLGFTTVDSFNYQRVFAYFCQKGRPGYPSFQTFTQAPADQITQDLFMPISSTHGRMFSTTVGPAEKWNSLKWRTSTKLDTAARFDTAYVKVIGIDTLNNETQLYQGYSRDTSLSYINAKQYRNLRMEWYSIDDTLRTSPQLDYWRILYDPVPEAALNPAIHFAFTDSLNQGQMGSLSVAIENLTATPMDSMLVKYKIIDANNVSHLLGAKRYRKMAGNDTLNADLTFDPNAYPGTNLLFVEANPDNDQPEQYHPNNLGYIPFKLIVDKYNPLVDVTFDGLHILNRDIVSSKPLIKIMLKDENQYQALDDTSLLDVYIRYPKDPQGSRRKIAFDGTTCKFIPGSVTNGKKNEAVIEYTPVFTDDSTYELYVTGRDKAGNEAGGTKTDYSISFQVFGKPAISNVLNYPNPFSTSTAFVFTLTGSDMPSQFKIQIMTVTGKVVREIVKAELGPLHIGRNITDYKWDGRDQYGQLLGNGVYLYRVVTSINGSDVEHWETGADKYFKSGYGKMYIMR
ncbi:C25 family cysteine peptidase [Chitinophagaceae bacterium MMS25-I14]